jgi:hypothetical protein
VEGKPAGADRVTLERIVLQEEDRLLTISNALGLKDLRDQPLDKQVEEIRRAAAEAAHQPSKAANATNAQDFEARLKAANEGIQQGLTELAAKDQQLAAKDKQLEAQTSQLAEKDAQIKTLTDKVSQLEAAAKAAEKPKAAKSKAGKPKQQ